MAANGGTSHEGSTSGHHDLMKLLSEARQDIGSQLRRILPDLHVLRGLGSTILSGGIIDDREYLIEEIIQVATSLPNGSSLRDEITAEFVKTLWNGLEHPPIARLGDEYRYRAADGSNNNPLYPQLGAAGSHYVRSVTPRHPRPYVLPDSSLIFDTLLARSGPAKEHPSKISSSLFHFATIIIHDLFRTDDVDMTKLKNSSYLDLGPLYGHNAEQQKLVRTFQDGLLKPDTFAEQRLLGQPPGVCALIIAFNRFHNYIVKELAVINERGRFSLPPGITPESPGYTQAQAKRDNDLFQTGRLVTCGLYVNIILGDYLRTILNLNTNPVDSDWKLDPRTEISGLNSRTVPRGVGNQVSAEFNMIYRWHAAISNHDEAWLQGFMKEVFGPDVNASTLTVDEFLTGLQKWFQGVDRDPAKWTFGGLKRQPDGSFKDADLANILYTGTECVAGAFGANNIPQAMKAIEVLSIEQGRKWGLATLNEFRRFFKLKTYSTFEEVNPDPAVGEALETLYGHPDNIELYVGIQAEEAKQPFFPGSGLCPGFTISATILADANTLVRGDRFYTVDYSPVNLTNFGFANTLPDFDVAQGGLMYKLLLRAFPGWYTSNSVYALYPFTIPEQNQEIFTKRGTADQLDFHRPSYQGQPTAVTSWQGVTQVLNDQKGFRVPWGPHTYQLTQHDYMLSGDSSANAKQRAFVKERLYKPTDGLEEVRQFYEDVTVELLHKYSRKLGSAYQVDIVRDVGNLANTKFTAEFFGIPLRTPESKDKADGYTERELYDILAELFGYVFLDVDPVQSFKHRVTASRSSERLGEVMQKHVASLNKPHFALARDILRSHRTSEKKCPLADYGPELDTRLSDGGRSADEVAWTIIPTAAAACATQAQGWAQLIDFYLSDAYNKYWPDIQRVAQSDDKDSFEKLKKYALEGFRLSTPAFGVLRYAANDTTIEDKARTIPVKKGDTILADFVTAGRDPTKFPDPQAIKLDRPDELYIHHGWGPHSCLGREIVTVAAASMLRVFARVDGLRRSPGPAGEMKSKLINGAFKVYLPEDGTEWSPFPCNKKVLFNKF
ncbi:heme peroxidase [Aspergillus alliaceus]|uniref:Heme peroxidase n=1 Tax=Petromyces alliaceus TaxID=209559 RepID=A0A5N7C248_PETAA|nr:heme peroxidase [Aspergillus alliaceus]